MGKNQILVERETFEKDGKNYYSYFIKGKRQRRIYCSRCSFRRQDERRVARKAF